MVRLGGNAELYNGVQSHGVTTDLDAGLPLHGGARAGVVSYNALTIIHDLELGIQYPICGRG